LKNIGQVISGSNTVQIPENYSPTMVADLQYSPVTLVDVYNDPSGYIIIIILFNKNILTNWRTKMTPEHMEQYIIVIIGKFKTFKN